MCALYKIIIQILSKIISILIYKDYKDGDKSVLNWNLIVWMVIAY